MLKASETIWCLLLLLPWKLCSLLYWYSSPSSHLYKKFIHCRRKRTSM